MSSGIEKRDEDMEKALGEEAEGVLTPVPRPPAMINFNLGIRYKRTIMHIKYFILG